MKMPRAVPFALAVTLVAASASAGESHPWAKFKVGSYVKWKTTSVMEPSTVANPFEGETNETKHTLVQLTTDKAVVESIQGDRKDRFDLPFKTPPVDPKAPKPSKTGTETLTVVGRAFPCTWTETVTGKSTLRAWQSDAMPGSMVKTISKSEMAPGMTMIATTVVVEFLAK